MFTYFIWSVIQDGRHSGTKFNIGIFRGKDLNSIFYMFYETTEQFNNLKVKLLLPGK